MTTSTLRNLRLQRTGAALGFVLSLFTPAVFAQTAPTASASGSVGTPSAPSAGVTLDADDTAAPAPSDPAAVPSASTTAQPVDAPPPVAPAPTAVTPEPPPEAAPPATHAALDASAEAEAAAIEAELSGNSSSGSTEDGYKLDLYGFADVTYSQTVKKFELNPPYNTFAVGRLNLYLASELGDNWRTLAEVRFTYLPHGATVFDPTTGAAKRLDNTVGDYTDLNRPVRWSGIVLERAWLEYSFNPLFNLRAGHWLTPYGIWNVDHGSPVIVGVRRPFIVGESLFPTSQTGLELHGIYNVKKTKLGYHLTLSNGRGPLDTYQDLDYNKAIGGRLYASYDAGWGNITVGTSAFRGRVTDRNAISTFDADQNFITSRPETLQYKELSYAADLKVEAKGFLLQSEAIANEVAWKDALRPQAFAFDGGPPGFAADYRRYGVYGLTGYRFDFLGIMPFAGLEYYVTPSSGFIPKAMAVWGGLNVRPTPRVVLKAQYTYAFYPEHVNLPDATGNFNNLDLQAAWSF